VIQGIFHPGYQPVHQVSSRTLGFENALVIKGEAGEIERNPDVDCKALSVQGSELVEETWPKLFERRHVKETELDISLLVDTWQGKSTHEYGIAAIIGTTALALKLLGKASTQSEALSYAETLWKERNKSLI